MSRVQTITTEQQQDNEGRGGGGGGTATLRLRAGGPREHLETETPETSPRTQQDVMGGQQDIPPQYSPGGVQTSNQSTAAADVVAREAREHTRRALRLSQEALNMTQGALRELDLALGEEPMDVTSAEAALPPTTTTVLAPPVAKATAVLTTTVTGATDATSTSGERPADVSEETSSPPCLSSSDAIKTENVQGIPKIKQDVTTADVKMEVKDDVTKGEDTAVKTEPSNLSLGEAKCGAADVEMDIKQEPPSPGTSIPTGRGKKEKKIGACATQTSKRNTVKEEHQKSPNSGGQQPSSETTMKVLVKTLRGDTKTFLVSVDASVGELKTKISESTGGIHGAEYWLEYDGKHLEDGRLLRYYKVQNFSTLRMMGRLRGGGGGQCEGDGDGDSDDDIDEDDDDYHYWYDDGDIDDGVDSCCIL